MGAWIEIKSQELEDIRKEKSHPTMGAWIEILQFIWISTKYQSRTPRWVRGLKSLNKSHKVDGEYVAPHDGCVD